MRESVYSFYRFHLFVCERLVLGPVSTLVVPIPRRFGKDLPISSAFSACAEPFGQGLWLD